MSSPYLFHLSEQAPQDSSEGGERIKAYSGNFPALKGMSLYKIRLFPRGVREPHWHPNADELGVCLKGSVLVTFYHTYDLKQTFLVEAGQMFFIPSGALHALINVGEGDAELILQFSSDNPEEFNLASVVDTFPDPVLGNTFGVDKAVFESLKRPLSDRFATLTQKRESIPDEARYSNAYRFDVEGSQPLLNSPSGSARMARQNVWPILKRQSLYSLRLTKKGMREPHWHPETAEMGYVQAGLGLMTILNPRGEASTYTLKAGDLYFVPRAYPHHIETQSDELLHFLIFFDRATPEDVGFTGSIRSFSNEVLGSVLNAPASFFDPLHKYYSDLFIVDKIN